MRSFPSPLAIRVDFDVLHVFFFLFCRIWKKRRARGAEYHEVKVLHDEDDPLFLHHSNRGSLRSETLHDSEPEFSHSPDIPDGPEVHIR